MQHARLARLAVVALAAGCAPEGREDDPFESAPASASVSVGSVGSPVAPLVVVASRPCVVEPPLVVPSEAAGVTWSGSSTAVHGRSSRRSVSVASSMSIATST